MFEDRTISIYAYNIETVLAEKLETVISRGTANTRLRDFYDLYILQQEETVVVDLGKLRIALDATCRKRDSIAVMKRGTLILNQVYRDIDMQKLWCNYQKKFDYAANCSWDEVMESIQNLFRKIKE